MLYRSGVLIINRPGKQTQISLLKSGFIVNRIQEIHLFTLSLIVTGCGLPSMLFSIKVYWSSVIILPKAVIKQVEATLRAFLWKGCDLGTGGTKVVWEKLCMPKKEGGLGLRSIEIWNKAAKLKYLWSICTDSASSLWVSWERSYLLKGRSIWELKCPGDCSWIWRKILALREIGRDKMKFIIGNGRRTSLWFDNWHRLGPLQKILGERIIHESRFSRVAKVADIVEGDS
ncbi:unnamed protein product [Fraxinus pennsylvanica]|uniref:Uncharacterized protein n=1 Tax=Fraxinus pennsylvanica TaxID=56036 RepID=A0AAD2A197_9LAMI|nr:unnamed protein product [Fraxinus pennsylvanica]